jgi:hypothetical protein
VEPGERGGGPAVLRVAWRRTSEMLLKLAAVYFRLYAS